MAQITDCLKLAKFIARVQHKGRIEINDLGLAMAFFEEPDVALQQLLPHRYQLDPGIVKQLGRPILDAFETTPKMQLDDAVNAVLVASRRLHFKERYSSDLATSDDDIKAVRAVLITDYKKALAEFKPKSLEEAEKFADEVKKFADEVPKFMQGGLIGQKPAGQPAKPDEPEDEQDAAEEASQAERSSSTDTTGSLVQGPSIKGLRSALEEQLFGQPEACTQFLQVLQARAWGLATTNRPTTILLVGPSGCGKTLMTQVLGETYGTRRPMLTLNMGSMSNRNETFALTGLRHGYESAGPGRLTQFVRDNPTAIVVFDNIDRAHPMVQNQLLQLFTDGCLEDQYGFDAGASKGRSKDREVSFSKTIILFTTTKASGVYERRDFLSLYQNDPAALISLLEEEISQEIWTESGSDNSSGSSGFTSALPPYLAQTTILPFRSLDLASLYQIAGNSISALLYQLALRDTEALEKQVQGKLKMVVDSQEIVAQALTLSQGPDFNPLELQCAFERTILPALMKLDGLDNMVKVQVKVHEDGKTFLAQLDSDAGEPEVLKRNFFRRSERLKFIVRASLDHDGATCVLSLEQFSKERVPVSKDFGVEGGISIDLPNKSFADVFGHKYIKDRLQEVVKLLNKPVSVSGNAISLPKGMLLYGRPGTGKTMLAKALAAEAKLPFIAVTGPWLLHADNISKLFRLARKYAPSLIFIDEIDALGVRGKGGYDTSINQLLSEIDGFDEARDGSVFVMAATNFHEKVDPALTRSGRMDLRLEVPLLDREARRHFLQRLTQLPQKPLSAEEVAKNLDTLVGFSAGMSGADIERLLREASLDLIRRPREFITHAEIEELLNAIKYGAKVENPPLQEELEATAYHEAGHAVVSMVLNPHVRIEQISIIARLNALGFTAYNEESMDRRNFNRKEVMDLICVALAGRIAEDKQFPTLADGSNGPDAGASSDLTKATHLAWRAITEWGLDEEFGWASLTPWDEASPPTEWVNSASKRVDAWLREAKQSTAKTVAENWGQITAVAQALLEKETLDAATLRDLMEIVN